MADPQVDWHGENDMAGSTPSADVPVVAAPRLQIPADALGQATLLRADTDLHIIDREGQVSVVNGYFSRLPLPDLEGADGSLLASQAIVAVTEQLRTETFAPFQPFITDMPNESCPLAVQVGEWVTVDLRNLFGLAQPEDALEVRKTGNRGWLTCDGVVLRAGDSLSMEHLRNRQVRYYHDENPMGEADTLELATANNTIVTIPVQIRRAG